MLRVDSPIYTRPERVRGYTVPVSPLSAAYNAAGRLLRRRMPMDKGLHVYAGQQFLADAARLEQDYQKHVERELGFLRAQHLDPGPYISGIVSERFSENVKNDLRKLARLITMEREAAAAHYSAAGLRAVTFRRAFDASMGRPFRG